MLCGRFRKRKEKSEGLLAVIGLGESFRGGVPPGGDQRLSDRRLVGRGQFDAGAAAASPRAIERLECARLTANEHPLSVRRQLEPAPIVVRPKRGEDLAADAKVRV